MFLWLLDIHIGEFGVLGGLKNKIGQGKLTLHGYLDKAGLLDFSD